MILDINTHAGYTLATALRGPDGGKTYNAGDDALKSITTAVVRYMIGMRPKEDAGLNPPQPTYNNFGASVVHPSYAHTIFARLKPEVLEAARRRWRRDEHFRVHTLCALANLGIEGNAHLLWLTQEALPLRKKG